MSAAADFLHSMAIVRHMDDLSLQVVLDHPPKWRNGDLVLALLAVDAEARAHVLVNLNRIRRSVVGERLEERLAWLAQVNDRQRQELLDQSRDKGGEFARWAVYLEGRGSVLIMEKPLGLAPSLPDDWRTIPPPRAVIGQGRVQFADFLLGKEEGTPLPLFDLRTASLEETVRYWILVANGQRVNGMMILDAVRERLRDPYTRLGVDLIQDDLDDEEVLAVCTRKQEAILADLGRKGAMVIEGLTTLARYDQEPSRMGWTMAPFLAGELPDPLPGKGEADALPLAEMTPHQLAGWFVALARIAADHGLLYLEKLLKATVDPFLRKGLERIVDGADPVTLARGARIRAESLGYREEIKMRMFQEVLLGLRHGTNPRMLADLLLAHLPEPKTWDEVMGPDL